jgi:hypothetical protein
MEMENVRGGVRSFPGVGKVTVEDHVFVAGDEAAEEEGVDTLGLRVGGEARVERGGGGFDEEGERGGIVGGVEARRKRRAIKPISKSVANGRIEESFFRTKFVWRKEVLPR